MKKFHSEFAHSYKQYSFGYCHYARREQRDALSDIYEQGFLPFSGVKNVTNIFYMARSARIDLKHFTPTSENRRIARKFDTQFARKVIPIKDFSHTDKDFLYFCGQYFDKRHGKGIMPRERLVNILEGGTLTHIVVYTKGDKVVAYVFEVSDRDMAHFWFSFYDLTYIHQSLSMWLMIDALRHAKKNKKQHYYLGTVYGDKGLYKTNLEPLEYWDGKNWVNDVKKLRKKSRNDTAHIFEGLDEWKADPNY